MINEPRSHESLKKGALYVRLDDSDPPARMVHLATYLVTALLVWVPEALIIKDVNPKSQTLPPGTGNVELTITWETESDDEREGQISIGMHLDGSPPLEGNTFSMPVSQSPSKVTFDNVTTGLIGYSRDIVEIKAKDNTTLPGSIQTMLSTDQQDGNTQATPTVAPTSQTTLTMTPNNHTIDELVNQQDGDTQSTLTTATFATQTTLRDMVTTSHTSDMVSSTTSSRSEQSQRDPEPMASPSSTQQQPHGRNAGVIGGLVASVVVLIAIVSCIIIFWRRARRKMLRSAQTASISPFSDTASASDTAGLKQQQSMAQNHDQHTEKPDHGDASSPDVALDGRQQEFPEASQEERRECRVRYRDDSGFRPLPPPPYAGDSSVFDVPPRYEAAI
ncbi:hypothetical protein VNI00_015102 [Paramarasmius palmivorus]|uniref:Uncharacterized protein n=1 Tax=Paramarasmius palmivorus TaxID=297713 RepID=A0AAW0BQZ0_9AGAR